jgi:hypothetical protein
MGLSEVLLLTARMKIREMASERGVSVHELLLLSVLKTVHQSKDRRKIAGVEAVMSRRLTQSFRLYRLCIYLLHSSDAILHRKLEPDQKPSLKERAQTMDKIRINLQSARRYSQTFNKNEIMPIKPRPRKARSTGDFTEVLSSSSSAKTILSPCLRPTAKGKDTDTKIVR